MVTHPRARRSLCSAAGALLAAASALAAPPPPQPMHEVLSALADEARLAGRPVDTFRRFFGEADDPDAVWCLAPLAGAPADQLACVDAQGSVRSFDGARSAFREARYARDGSLEPGFAARLRAAAAADPAARFRARAWARLPSPLPREAFTMDLQGKQAFDARWIEARDAVTNACQALGDELCLVERPLTAYVTLSGTAAGLFALGQHPQVGPITEWEAMDGISEMGGDDYLRSAAFDVAQGFNPPLEGAGVTVAVVEAERITDTTRATGAFDGIVDFDNDVYCTTGVALPHPDMVASVIAVDPTAGAQVPVGAGPRSLDGASPGVRLLIGNHGRQDVASNYCKPSAEEAGCAPVGCTREEAYDAVHAWLRNHPPLTDVINRSYNIGSTLAYPSVDRFQDWVVASHPWPVMVAVVGNQQLENPKCSNSTDRQSRTTCYNCIVVGGSNTKDTVARGDDTLWSGACWGNRATGLEVPHVVAPAFRHRLLAEGVWSRDPIGATSWAAPAVSGLAAALLGRHTNLKSYPEGVRAMVMATATRDTDAVPLDLADNNDHRDGAGQIHAGHAARILDEGATNLWKVDTQRGVNYGQVDLDPAAWVPYQGGLRYTDWVQIKPASDATIIQATLTWNVASSCSSLASACPTALEPEAIASYALKLERLGTVVAASTPNALHHNYAHIRYDSAVPGDVYYLDVYLEWKNPVPPDLSYFGLAWTSLKPEDQ